MSDAAGRTADAVVSNGNDRRLLLEADGIDVRYKVAGRPAVHAVKHASFALREGEILGVVGESGSGKTTLGRVVAGFLPPTSGTIRLAGPDGELRPLTIQANHGLRNVQMVFQESALALDPRMPAWRSVAEALAPGGGRRQDLERRRATAVEHLNDVGLGEAAAKRRPNGLSGGEKQRVAIARAVAAKPTVLVCDEAVAALDVTVRAAILVLLRRIVADTNLALFFIAHDMSVVSSIADTTAVMFDGEIVEYGDTRQVIDDPQHAYTRRLIDAVPPLQRGLLPT